MGADATQKLVDQINQRVAPRGQGSVSIQDHSARRGHFNMGRGMQIRMVAGFAEVIDREETLVATACNHPNCLVLPFRFPMLRAAA
jgi:hypothetical protein